MNTIVENTNTISSITLKTLNGVKNFFFQGITVQFVDRNRFDDERNIVLETNYHEAKNAFAQHNVLVGSTKLPTNVFMTFLEVHLVKH